MKRPVFSFRPNMDNPEHKKAWKILQGVPDGKKNAFLVQAILQVDNREYLKQIIQETVREELGHGEMQHRETRKMGIPNQMLDFLKGL